MTNRLSSVALTLVAVALLAAPVLAQSATADRDAPPPRTSWGAPDLQGTWSHATVTPLERREEHADRAFLTDEEVAEANLNAATFASSERRDELSAERDVGLAYNQFWWDRGQSDGRTSLIVDPPDGRLPPLQPAAQSRADERRAGAEARRGRVPEGPEDRGDWERCLTLGVPRLGGAYNNNFQVFQTPEHVAILHEMVHETRIIPLDVQPHVDSTIRQWLGDSRGRWDGDTLVVETTNFGDKRSYRGSSPELTLVERFTRVNASTLRYEVTVDDPETWTRPWTAALDMPPTDGQIYEYACHERNYGMENLLKGARVQEAASTGTR